MWTIQLLGGLSAHSVQRHLTRFRTQKAASLLAFQKGLTLLADKLESVATLYQAAIDRPVPDVELWNAWRRVARHLRRIVRVMGES